MLSLNRDVNINENRSNFMLFVPKLIFLPDHYSKILVEACHLLKADFLLNIIHNKIEHSRSEGFIHPDVYNPEGSIGLTLCSYTNELVPKSRAIHEN